MFESLELTCDTIDALFNAENAKSLDVFADEELIGIAGGPSDGAVDARKTFLSRLLPDATRHGVTIELLSATSGFVLSFGYRKPGHMRIRYDMLDTVHMADILTICPEMTPDGKLVLLKCVPMDGAFSFRMDLIGLGKSGFGVIIRPDAGGSLISNLTGSPLGLNMPMRLSI